MKKLSNFLTTFPISTETLILGQNEKGLIEIPFMRRIISSIYNIGASLTPEIIDIKNGLIKDLGEKVKEQTKNNGIIQTIIYYQNGLIMEKFTKIISLHLEIYEFRAFGIYKEEFINPYQKILKQL